MLKRLVYLMLALAAMNTYAEDAPAFSLNTNGFLDKGIMPVLYTCDGKDVSPQFSISNTPSKAKSLAFILDDIDAPKPHFYHWVLFNLPTKTTELQEGPAPAPAGSVAGLNSFNKPGYNGPCPPKGHAHYYAFTLYALDTSLKLPADSSGDAVMAAIKGHIIEKATFTGAYSRWIK